MPRFFLMNDATEEEIQEFIDSGYFNLKSADLYMPERRFNIYHWVEAENGDDAALEFAYDWGPQDPAYYLDKTLYYKILQEGEEDCIEYQLVNRGWEIV